MDTILKTSLPGSATRSCATISITSRGEVISEPVIFQGGVAANPGIKAAFERELGKEFIVPEYYPIMGAIGAALLARTTKKTRSEAGQLRNSGFDSSFYCSDCPNSCGVIEINDSDRVIAAGGLLRQVGKTGGVKKLSFSACRSSACRNHIISWHLSLMPIFSTISGPGSQ